MTTGWSERTGGWQRGVRACNRGRSSGEKGMGARQTWRSSGKAGRSSVLPGWASRAAERASGKSGETAREPLSGRVNSDQSARRAGPVSEKRDRSSGARNRSSRAAERSSGAAERSSGAMEWWLGAMESSSGATDERPDLPGPGCEGGEQARVRAVAERRLRCVGLSVPAVMVCADEVANRSRIRKGISRRRRVSVLRRANVWSSRTRRLASRRRRRAGCARLEWRRRIERTNCAMRRSLEERSTM